MNTDRKKRALYPPAQKLHAGVAAKKRDQARQRAKKQALSNGTQLP